MSRQILLVFVLTAAINGSGCPAGGRCLVPTEPITTSFTMSATCGEYYVGVNTDIVVADGGELIIEPGVTLLFDALASLRIDAGGRLTAEGFEELPITFRSARPDNFIPGSAPNPGDWVGLRFLEGSGPSIVRNALILHAGGGRAAFGGQAAITVRTDQVIIEQVSFQRSNGGVFLLDGVQPEPLNKLSFTDLLGSAFDVHLEQLALIGADNTFDDGVINVRGNKLREPMVVKNLGAAYLFSEGLLVENEPEASLTVEAGAELRFAAGTGLDIGLEESGSLHAVGTAADPIVLRFAEQLTQAGGWAGVRFGAGSQTSELIYVDLSSAGGVHNGDDEPNKGAVTVLEQAGLVSISDSLFYENAGVDVWIDGGTRAQVIDRNVFDGRLAGPSTAVSIDADAMGTIGAGNVFSQLHAQESIAVEVRGGRVRNSAQWPQLSSPWRINSPIEIGDNVLRPNITIAPGAQFRFAANSYIQVGFTGPGRFTANAAGADAIEFFSAADTGAAGDWVALVFNYQCEQALLDNVVVRHTGGRDLSGLVQGPGGVTIRANGSNTSVLNSVFEISSGAGIWYDCASLPNLMGNSFIATNGTEVQSSGVPCP